MAVFVSSMTTPPRRFDATFSANSWENIIEACQTNRVPSTWNVGDSKIMTIGGVDYQIDIIGKNHDIYSDGTGAAPLTFQFHDCYETKYNMNSSNTTAGGWLGSLMRLTNLPTIFDSLPIEIRAGIRQVNKKTSIGSQQSSINTAQDTLFLLSEVEVFGLNAYSRSGEGTQYEYYANGASPAKTLNSGIVNCWLRSPYSSGTAPFCIVASTGEANYSNASSINGVAPAFCF